MLIFDSKPMSDLRSAAHEVQGNFLQQMFLTNYLLLQKSHNPSVPLLSSGGSLVIPVSYPWLGLHLPGALLSICEDNQRDKKTSPPAAYRIIQTFSCHFQVKATLSPLV